MQSFICFISSYICSGGRLATARLITSGALVGSTALPYGFSSGGPTDGLVSAISAEFCSPAAGPTYQLIHVEKEHTYSKRAAIEINVVQISERTCSNSGVVVLAKPIAFWLS